MLVYEDRSGYQTKTEKRRGKTFYAIEALPRISTRLRAEMIDREISIFLITPVIAVAMILIDWGLFVSVWLPVIFLWSILRDCSPGQRSIGKSRRRLIVVMSNGRDRCSIWRRFFRRTGYAISQFCYFLGLAMCFPLFGVDQSADEAATFLFGLVGMGQPDSSRLMLFGLIYDIGSLVVISIDPESRRLEDFITGTRVVTEAAYLEGRARCIACHRPMSIRLSHCQNCGEENPLNSQSRPWEVRNQAGGVRSDDR